MKISNRAISKNFKETLDFFKTLDPLEQSFICWYLSAPNRVRPHPTMEWRYNNSLFYVASACCHIIESRLSDNTLQGWLDDTLGNEYRNVALSYKDQRRKLYATRCAWLESLVKEFDKDGYYVFSF